MGAWGTGLYADDTTCDVRDDYVAHLKQGLGDDAVWQAIVQRHGALMDDRTVACLVYFALADTAWRQGRLGEELKRRALELLASGGDLPVWESAADQRARRRVLNALATRLQSPQPAPKALRIAPPPAKKIRTTAPVGSAFALALPSGRRATLVLAGFKDVGGSIDPVFSVAGMAFQSGTGPKAHVAILPGDERKSVMTALEPLPDASQPAPPFQPDSVVWLSIQRIAREIDAQRPALD